MPAFFIVARIDEIEQDRDLARIKSLESFINPEAYRKTYKAPMADRPRFKIDEKGNAQPDEVMKKTADAAASLLADLIKG